VKYLCIHIKMCFYQTVLLSRLLVSETWPVTKVNLETGRYKHCKWQRKECHGKTGLQNMMLGSIGCIVLFTG